MPHTTYGLLSAIRSHLISSPRVQSQLDTGRPNACNLCHLDRSLAWTGRSLQAWYGQPLPPLSPQDQSTSSAALTLLSGDAGQRALVAWHMGWEPARRISGEDWLGACLPEILVDPYATVRYIAGRSLRQLPGFEKFSYDYIASPAQRLAARAQALSLYRDRRQKRPEANAVLLEPDGSRQEERITSLLRQRDDHPMELLE
jgi:hypothetical protein